nr:uncharacterized protein LOC126523572 isoform X2 [Dermacentor andersoni]
MPRPCDVVGCANGPRNLAKGSCSGESKVTYHCVPTNEPLRSKWLSAIPLPQRVGKEPKNRIVCSLHFRPDDYEFNADLLKSCGVPYKAMLSRSAVPSVLPAFSEAQELQVEDGAAARSNAYKVHTLGSRAKTGHHHVVKVKASTQTDVVTRTTTTQTKTKKLRSQGTNTGLKW